MSAAAQRAPGTEPGVALNRYPGQVPPDSAFRADIQALRGYAVLLVLFYHAGLSLPKAGYLGVDIFFVISGYLITSIVRRDIVAERFSFAQFYQRRAKRLLPAAYIVFLITAVFSALTLGQAELRDFTKQLAGALTFTGNMVLWRQIGYFEIAAEFKPLLHVWSLAIEEQYYLLLPAALVFTPRRFWLKGAGAAAIASLALCWILNPIMPGVTFYLLPTRAWELGIGSLGALYLHGVQLKRLATTLFWPSVAALIAIPFHPIGSPGLGMDTLAVCAATLIVIVRHHHSFGRALAVEGLAVVGNFSYSLYLVHWPIFALVRNVWVGDVPGYVSALCTAASLLLGYLLFATVEKPVRQARFHVTTWAVGGAVAASALLLAIPLGAIRARSGEPDFQQIKRTNYGLDRACEFTGTFSPIPQCQTSAQPEVFVWGDSYAMHLVPGIISGGPPLALGQATRTACGPFLNLAPITKRISLPYNRQWAESCIQFNQSVLDYLAQAPWVKVVVLSTPFTSYVNSEEWQLLRGTTVEEPQIERSLASLVATVEAIHALGKRAVIVGPPPAAGFDTGACLERKATGRPNLGPNSNCEIGVASFHQKRSGELAFLDAVAKQQQIDVIRLDSYLCSNGVTCRTALDGTALYRDPGHLSYQGSQVLAARMGLRSLIFSHAR